MVVDHGYLLKDTQQTNENSPLPHHAELIVHQMLEDVKAEEKDFLALLKPVDESVTAQEPIVGNGKV